MILFAKQKQRHRHREQTYEYQWGKEDGMHWETGIGIYMLCARVLIHGQWQPTRLLSPQDLLSKNTGVGGHALLQGIFPT